MLFTINLHVDGRRTARARERDPPSQIAADWASGKRRVDTP
jgi:hypothetical protein